MTLHELAVEDSIMDFRLETKIFVQMKKDPSGAIDRSKSYMQVETKYSRNPPRDREQDEPNITSWDARLDIQIPKEGLYNSSWKLDPQDMDKDLINSTQTHIPLSKEIVRLQQLIETSLTESEFMDIDANNGRLSNIDADAADWSWTDPLPIITPPSGERRTRRRPPLRYKMLPQCRLRERLLEAEGRQTRLQQRPGHDQDTEDELAAINDWLKLLARAMAK